MIRSRYGARRTVGVAIGPTSIVAHADSMRGTEPWSRTLDPAPANAAAWPALVDALRELRASVPGANLELAAALLPPLAELRPVTLPPLAADAARQIVSRNAGRYFLAGQEPQVIALAPRSASAGAESDTWIAAAATTRILEAIHAAAREAGWKLRRVIPAEAAWCAAALAIWPSLREGTHEVTVGTADRTEVLKLAGGVLAGVRRFPAQAGGISARQGESPLIAAAEWRALLQSPAMAAAAFASRGRGLELVSISVRQHRRARQRVITVAFSAAAAIFFIGAAWLELWGVRRELDHVKQERASIRAQVGSLAATRDLAIATRGRLGELAAMNRNAVAWSDVLVNLVETLPQDAHLVALRASGDSLVLEGLATSAARTFAAIESAPDFVEVQSAAPVRRDLRDRTITAPPERFSIAARVRGGPDSTDTSLALSAPERP